MRWLGFVKKIRSDPKIIKTGDRRIFLSRRFLLLTLVCNLFLAATNLVGSALAQTRPSLIWSQQERENTTQNGAIAYSRDGQFVASGRADSNDVNIRSALNGT